MTNPVDKSLNILRDLQARLRLDSPHPYPPTDYRSKTDHNMSKLYPQSFSQHPQLLNFYPQPDIPVTMPTQQQLWRQNRLLRKHVDRLMRMNDYLKNQLVKQDHYSVRYLSNKVEAGLANAADLQTQQMLEEIEYLKQANKHKEKQMEAIRRKKVKEIKEGDLKQLMLASLSTLNTMQTPKKKLSRRELSKSANTCETMVLTKPTKRKASKNQCRLCYSRSVM